MYFKNYLYSSLLIVLTSCLSHDEIVVRQDQDLIELSKFNTQLQTNIIGKSVKKTIAIDGESEISILKADSLFMKNEFNKITNLDFEKIFLNGEYEKSISNDLITYKHMQKATSGPVELIIEKDDNNNTISQKIKYYTSNYLFESSFDFFVRSKESSIQSYSIEARQKLIGMDATEYSIKGEVLTE